MTYYPRHCISEMRAEELKLIITLFLVNLYLYGFQGNLPQNPAGSAPFFYHFYKQKKVY